jgi:hypothetical protein
MQETPTRIRFKKTLGKRPDILLIPGRFAVAWLGIVTSCGVFYVLFNPYLAINPLLMAIVCLTMILTHWILIGDFYFLANSIVTRVNGLKASHFRANLG